MSQFDHIGGVFPGRHRLSLAVIGFQTYPGSTPCHDCLECVSSNVYPLQIDLSQYPLRTQSS